MGIIMIINIYCADVKFLYVYTGDEAQWDVTKVAGRYMN